MGHVEFRRVASAGQIEDGCAIEVTIGNEVIALFRLGDDYYATAGICTHAHARLVEGYVEGNAIECPFHGGSFDIRTGQALTAPCTRDLPTYPVRVEGDAILVGIATDAA